MAEYLVIRMREDDGPVEWIAVDGSGARRGAPGSGSLDEAAADVGERAVTVLVPGTEVLTTTVDLPVKGGAKLQAALPYALEEVVAEDIDKLHFAAGNRRSSGRVPVSVVRRDILEGWIARLKDAGIPPASIVAENYGLARIPGTISLLVAENQVIINDGADTELVMQGVSPGDALAAIGALDEDGAAAVEADASAARAPLPRHVLVYCEPGVDERYEHDWLAIRKELDSLDLNLLPDGVTPRLAVTVATGAGVNLLQGDFARRTAYGGLLRPWRYAAVLLAGFILVAVGAKAADYYALSRQETAFRQQFQEEYRELAPGAPAVEDPAALVSSLRARAGTSGPPQLFLQSLAELSRALRQNDQARIEAISYRAGVVDIRLSAPDVATLDSIRRTISESGRFAASIRRTDQDGDRVNSQIQIQPRGA